MFRIQRILRDFFGFSHGQVNAFIVMLPLMAFAIFSEPFYHWWTANRAGESQENHATLDSLVSVWNTKPHEEGGNKKFEERTLFRFNPNQISMSEMNSLGFSAALSARITHYREKGGKFLIRADLAKIYGIDTSLYQSLYPYIDLPEKKIQTIHQEKPTEKSFAFASKKREVVSFDLNEADTSQLKTVYGIGEKLSMRIIKYRESLGGFVAMQQLSEIYGLDTIVVKRLLKQCFIEDGFVPAVININTSIEKELSAHPYLRGSVAKAIVSYRFQHGEFKSAEDLRKIPVLNEELIQKIKPYLKFGK
jgi:competence protein ComEA